MLSRATCGISSSFPLLSPTEGQVIYVLLDRSPLAREQALLPVRLAYLRHAASVRPEPGSNSPRELSSRPLSRQLVVPHRGTSPSPTTRAGSGERVDWLVSLRDRPLQARHCYLAPRPLDRRARPYLVFFPLFSFQGSPVPSRGHLISYRIRASVSTTAFRPGHR